MSYEFQFVIRSPNWVPNPNHWSLETLKSEAIVGSTLGLAKSIVWYMYKTRQMESIHLALKVSLKMDWKAVQYIQFGSLLLFVCF